MIDATVLDKIVTKKLTPYRKVIPHAPPPPTMLTHEIVLLVTYNNPNIEEWVAGRNTNLQKALILLTQKDAFHNLWN